MRIQSFEIPLRGHVNNNAPSAELPRPMQARRLLDHWADFRRQHQFKLGDLVEWKPGWNGEYRVPSIDAVAVVIDLYDPPLFDDESRAGMPCFGHEFDIRIAFIDNDGGLISLAVSSRLFQPYAGAVETGVGE
jgi:hypothetical protein